MPWLASAHWGWLLTGLLLLSCSRSSGGEPTPERAASAAPSGVLGVTPSSESPAASAGPVLTPEDVELDIEHRITEQNLESELDRLEREIQAE